MQGREVPFPSAADGLYLLAVPLLAAGLLALPGSPTGAAGRLRLVLDGLVVAAPLAAELGIERLMEPFADGYLRFPVDPAPTEWWFRRG